MAQALALAFWPFGHATRTATRARLATLCERRCDLTQIKRILSYFIIKGFLLNNRAHST
ncbi:hypothetical protein [Moorena sp. SIO3A5]|uniref:hypothetical protein n=1 Tax=Moorena sp. SIO3A5 TaxID=2607822 RepID=UPI0003061DC6|nr:hypothetical protein [Moorena sp. SIO3A5]